ncbi:MAG: Zn-dependent hydrolase [Deltaproteobacteria bacterium]|nr:MAG: Zn-dependent hydrolase [Deltaproteobacteria bacterium]
MNQLTDNILLLGNRYFNHIVVGKQEAAIIECGVTGSVESLKSQWQRLDKKPHIRYLVAMHAHFDHVCGIPMLQALFPEARVLASKIAQEVLTKPKIVRNFFYQDAKMSEVLFRKGVLSEKPKSSQVDTIEVNRIVKSGMVLDLPDHLTLETISAPGHSPCSIALYLPKDQVMIVSDACGFQISDSEIFPIFFQSYALYIQTIKKLMRYPTRILVTAHGRIWLKEDVTQFYQRALNSARAAFDEIRKMITNTDDRTIIQKLFSLYYRKNLRIYSPENINTCVQLLVKRVNESL